MLKTNMMNSKGMRNINYRILVTDGGGHKIGWIRVGGGVAACHRHWGLVAQPALTVKKNKTKDISCY